MIASCQRDEEPAQHGVHKSTNTASFEGRANPNHPVPLPYSLLFLEPNIGESTERTKKQNLSILSTINSHEVRIRLRLL